MNPNQKTHVPLEMLNTKRWGAQKSYLSEGTTLQKTSRVVFFKSSIVKGFDQKK